MPLITLYVFFLSSVFFCRPHFTLPLRLYLPSWPLASTTLLSVPGLEITLEMEMEMKTDDLFLSS